MLLLQGVVQLLLCDALVGVGVPGPVSCCAAGALSTMVVQLVCYCQGDVFGRLDRGVDGEGGNKMLMSDALWFRQFLVKEFFHNLLEIASLDHLAKNPFSSFKLEDQNLHPARFDRRGLCLCRCFHVIDLGAKNELCKLSPKLIVIPGGLDIE